MAFVYSIMQQRTVGVTMKPLGCGTLFFLQLPVSHPIIHEEELAAPTTWCSFARLLQERFLVKLGYYVLCFLLRGISVESARTS